MMSTELSVKAKNPFSTMLNKTFKKNISYIIFATVIALLTTPAQPILQIIRNSKLPPAQQSLNAVSGVVWASIYGSWIIGAMLIILLSTLNHNYMHSKKSSDAYFALPITRKSLFSSHCLASFIGGCIPFFVSGIATVILCIFAKGTPNVINVAIFIVYGIVYYLSLTVICGFFMLFTGHTLDAYISGIVVNVAVPIIVLVFILTGQENLYGIPENNIASIGFFNSSIVGNAGFTMAKICFAGNNTAKALSSVCFGGIIWFAISIAIFIFSLWFTGKRKSEFAGEAYSNPLLPMALKIIVGLLAAFCFGALFSLSVYPDAIFIIFAFVGGILATVLIGAIIHRGFKKFLTDAVVGVVTAAIIIGYLAIIVTGGAGYEKYVPDSSSISNATFICRNTDISSTTLTKAEDIEKLVELHKKITQYGKTQEEEYYDTDVIEPSQEEICPFSFSVVYKLKNGKKSARNYDLLIPKTYLKELKALLSSNDLYNNYEIKIQKGKEKSITGELPTNGDEANIKTLSQEQVKEIFNNYKKDAYYNITSADKYYCDLHIDGISVLDKADNLFNSNDVFDDVLFMSYLDETNYYTTNLTLTENSVNTINCLKQLGFEVTSLSDNTYKAAVDETF